MNLVVNFDKGQKSLPYYNFLPVRCYALHYKLAWFCSLLTGNLLFSWLISQNLIFVHKALTFFKVHFKFEVKTSCHRWEISIYYCLTPKVTGDHATGHCISRKDVFFSRLESCIVHSFQARSLRQQSTLHSLSYVTDPFQTAASHDHSVEIQTLIMCLTIWSVVRSSLCCIRYAPWEGGGCSEILVNSWYSIQLYAWVTNQN